MNTVSFETGASDHHKRIETMLWSTFATVNLRKIFYRCHKNFDNEKFEEELKTHWRRTKNAFIFSARFWIVPLCIQNDSRPICTFKTKKQQPFMTKTLRKVIMKRSKLRNKWNKRRKAKNWFD